jgi:hypothetical protein
MVMMDAFLAQLDGSQAAREQRRQAAIVDARKSTS